MNDNFTFTFQPDPTNELTITNDLITLFDIMTGDDYCIEIVDLITQLKQLNSKD